MMVTPMLLPQPPCLQDCYTYVPYDVLECDWLGDPLRLKEALSSIGAKVTEDGNENKNEINNSSIISSDGDPSHLSRYAPGTLVWVLLSRGKKNSTIHPTKGNGDGGNALALHKKRRDKKNKRRIDVETYNAEIICTNDEEDDDEPDVDNDGVILKQHYSRKEFFLRARIVSDDEEIIIGNNCNDYCNDPTTLLQKRNLRQVLVRYEGGTTYHVKAYNLVPILEPTFQLLNINASLLPKHIVLIVPETSMYRRLAKIHTTPQDSFMEIGCDFGITVDRIRESLVTAGNVPREWPPPSSTTTTSVIMKEDEQERNLRDNNNDNETKDTTKVSCLGVDKSKDSIDIANQRYPKSKFVQNDVLVPHEMSLVRILCEQCLVGSAPSILCIDINGNREIEGVLACLTMVMNEPWIRMPRIIIVKSRFLYWEMKRRWKSEKILPRIL